MKSLMKRLLALTGVVAMSLASVHAQDSGALLDALVKKGILTDQESEDIRAQLSKDFASTPAGKFAVSNYVTQLKLYGDARVRFENIEQTTQNQTKFGGPTTTDRMRYRLRVGADYTFTDHFMAGFELESATANDSANQTFGTGFNKSSINVGLIYLKYKAADWLTLTTGKFKNPLYTTDLVWDPDINPEGGAEELNFDINDNFSVGLTAGQFIYADNSESASQASGKNDVWIFAQQLPLTYTYSKDINAKIAPGFSFYTSGGTTGFATITKLDAGSATTTAGTYSKVAYPSLPVSGGTVTASATGGSGVYAANNGADALNLLTLPGEVNFKVFDLPVKPYFDTVYNITGKDRIQNVYGVNGKQNYGLGDNAAWLAGVQIGQNKKKGDWSIKADYRQVGLGSIDPNIADSDFANGSLNQEGVKASAAYNLTDFLTIGVTYFNTSPYKGSLLTGYSPVVGNTQGLIGGSNNNGAIQNTQRVQADLSWKF